MRRHGTRKPHRPASTIRYGNDPSFFMPKAADDLVEATERLSTNGFGRLVVRAAGLPVSSGPGSVPVRRDFLTCVKRWSRAILIESNTKGRDVQ
jgi:hypothetical protein